MHSTKTHTPPRNLLSPSPHEFTQEQLESYGDNAYVTSYKEHEDLLHDILQCDNECVAYMEGVLSDGYCYEYVDNKDVVYVVFLPLYRTPWANDYVVMYFDNKTVDQFDLWCDYMNEQQEL